jgi:hypothetical protein
MTGPGNHVNISGVNNGPMIFGGTSHGPISGGTSDPGPAAGTELLDLIRVLRAQVWAGGIAKQEIIEDNLAELAEAADAGGSVAPAVPVSRWERVQKLLGGASEFTGIAVKISEQVAKLWPS